MSRFVFVSNRHCISLLWLGYDPFRMSHVLASANRLFVDRRACVPVGGASARADRPYASPRRTVVPRRLPVFELLPYFP